MNVPLEDLDAYMECDPDPVGSFWKDVVSGPRECRRCIYRGKQNYGKHYMNVCRHPNAQAQGYAVETHIMRMPGRACGPDGVLYNKASLVLRHRKKPWGWWLWVTFVITLVAGVSIFSFYAAWNL